MIKRIFYGFRFHVRACRPGVITRLIVAPAKLSDTAMLEQLLEGTSGYYLGGRRSWQPEMRERLHNRGVATSAPFKKANRDPETEWSGRLGRWRYRIETAFSRAVERLNIKRVWARDAASVEPDSKKGVGAYSVNCGQSVDE